MFQSLRQGSLIYVLTKGDKPTLQICNVTNVTPAQPKARLTFTASYGQPEMVVDISAQGADEPLEFKQLPAMLGTAYYGTTIVTDTQQAMQTEVESMLRQSQQVIDSIEYHKSILEHGESIIRTLNPQYRKDREQQEEISGLKSELHEMKAMLARMMGTKNKEE